MRLAVLAAVRTEPLRLGLQRGIALESLLHGDADRARYARAATERRRVEFVAGRIAARCALALNGGGHVSIAHTRGLAVAAASDRPTGIDVEPASRVLSTAAREIAHDLPGWLVFEAIGKLTGGGVLAPLDGARRPAVVAIARWCDHLVCITVAEEDGDGPGSRL